MTSLLHEQSASLRLTLCAKAVEAAQVHAEIVERVAKAHRPWPIQWQEHLLVPGPHLVIRPDLYEAHLHEIFARETQGRRKSSERGLSHVTNAEVEAALRFFHPLVIPWIEQQVELEYGDVNKNTWSFGNDPHDRRSIALAEALRYKPFPVSAQNGCRSYVALARQFPSLDPIAFITMRLDRANEFCDLLDALQEPTQLWAEVAPAVTLRAQPYYEHYLRSLIGGQLNPAQVEYRATAEFLCRYVLVTERDTPLTAAFIHTSKPAALFDQAVIDGLFNVNHARVQHTHFRCTQAAYTREAYDLARSTTMMLAERLRLATLL